MQSTATTERAHARRVITMHRGQRALAQTIARFSFQRFTFAPKQQIKDPILHCASASLPAARSARRVLLTAAALFIICLLRRANGISQFHYWRSCRCCCRLADSSVFSMAIASPQRHSAASLFHPRSSKSTPAPRSHRRAFGTSRVFACFQNQRGVFRSCGASPCSADPSAALACDTHEHRCVAVACCGVQRSFERAACAEADLLSK